VTITGARSSVPLPIGCNTIAARRYTGVHKRQSGSLAGAEAGATAAGAGAAGAAKGGAKVAAAKAAVGAAALAIQPRRCDHPGAVALRKNARFEARGELYLLRHSLQRLLNEAVVNCGPGLLLTVEAVAGMQKAAEAYLVKGFEDAVQ